MHTRTQRPSPLPPTPLHALNPPRTPPPLSRRESRRDPAPTVSSSRGPAIAPPPPRALCSTAYYFKQQLRTYSRILTNIIMVVVERSGASQIADLDRQRAPVDAWAYAQQNWKFLTPLMWAPVFPIIRQSTARLQPATRMCAEMRCMLQAASPRCAARCTQPSRVLRLRWVSSLLAGA